MKNLPTIQKDNLLVIRKIIQLIFWLLLYQFVNNLQKTTYLLIASDNPNSNPFPLSGRILRKNSVATFPWPFPVVANNRKKKYFITAFSLKTGCIPIIIEKQYNR